MLGEADLRILTALATPKSVTELGDATGYSRSYVSERVAHLADYDLVVTSRESHTKQVRAVPTTVLETYRELMAKHSHVDFPSVLSPSMLRVCWFLDTPTAVSEMQSRLTLQRRRIYQLLETLQRRGLVQKTGDEYVLPDDLTTLAEFAQVVVEYEHEHSVQSLLPQATVVWSEPHEALVTITGDIDAERAMEAFADRENWHLTGLPRFDDYGLEFFVAGPPPFFYTELRDELTPTDFVCHTLAVDADVRNVSYCALLVLAADIDSAELRDVATRYEIEPIVDALVTLIETHSASAVEMSSVRLPDWDEVTSLASQYGVSV